MKGEGGHGGYVAAAAEGLKQRSWNRRWTMRTRVRETVACVPGSAPMYGLCSRRAGVALDDVRELARFLLGERYELTDKGRAACHGPFVDERGWGWDERDVSDV